MSKYYGNFLAVDDISFTVEKGEVLGFLGPNGAGKTTTMRILTCYMPPSKGTARVGGYDVVGDSLEVRRRIGYLPEHPPLYTDMTVDSYLNFVSKIKGVDDKEKGSRIGYVMERCGLEEVEKDLISKLSKGYRQRVGVAQALIHNPDVVILDEPTIGLDPRQIIEVRDLIKNLAGDHTVILSTHILPEVSVTCQRVAIINKGKIAAVDTPENLNTRFSGNKRVFLDVNGPPNEVVRSIEEIPEVINVDVKGEGDGYYVESSADVRSQLSAKIVGNNFELLEIRPVGMSLEEIFLHITTVEEEVQAQ